MVKATRRGEEILYLILSWAAIGIVCLILLACQVPLR